VNLAEPLTRLRELREAGGRRVVARRVGGRRELLVGGLRLLTWRGRVADPQKEETPMRHRSILIAVAILGVLAVGASVAVIVFVAQSTPPTALTQPTWTLTRLVVDGQEQALSSSSPATLHFGAHNGQFSASGGCNTFGGAYALHGTQLQFSGLYSTAIGCLDPVVSGQERRLYEALAHVATYRLEANTLTLTGDGGRVQLTFRAR
jgi:heat shock protein HslJ